MERSGVGLVVINTTADNDPQLEKTSVAVPASCTQRLIIRTEQKDCAE